MAIYNGLTELRAAVELRAGPIPDELWSRVAPDPFPDAFSDGDVTDLCRDLAEDLDYQRPIAAALERVVSAIGAPSGGRLLTQALMSVPNLEDVLQPVLLGPAAPRVSPSARETGDMLASLGQLVVMFVAARSIANNKVIAMPAALTMAFGLDTAQSPLFAHSEVVDFLSSLVGRGRRSGFAGNWALYHADQAVREECFAATIGAINESPKGALHRIAKRGLATADGTWQERWMHYEAKHAADVGRSFPSHHAYRLAVRRAHQSLNDFVRRAERRVPSPG